MSKGESFQLQLPLQEDVQGRILTGTQRFRIESKPLAFQARVVAGWDPDSRQVRLFAFWNEGFMEELFFSRREGNTFFGTCC